MNKQFKKQLQLFTILNDFLCFYASFALTNNLFYFQNHEVANFIDWKYGIIYWFFVSILTGLYSKKTITRLYKLLNKTIKTCLIFTLILFIKFLLIDNLTELINQFIYSNVFILIALIIISRLICDQIFRLIFSKNNSADKVLILGYNETSIKLADYLNKELPRYQLVGFAENKNNIHSVSNYPILADLEHAFKIAVQYDVRQIFSTISPKQNSFVRKLIRDAEDACIRFRMVPDFSSITDKNFKINYLNDLPVFSTHNESLDDQGNIYFKRFLDLTISLFVIIFILSWLIPLIGLLIKLESKGPVIFSQFRTGMNKHQFECFKFRSMKLNTEADSIQATKNDSRVTKLGKFLRKTSLDEFPQFINVLKGEMSIVGPRPLMIKHTEEYSKIVDEYMLRHFLKPGITGWAQIHGLRGEITDQSLIIKRVSYDLWYLENWSIALDLKIIFLTFFNLVFKKQNNAY